MIGLRTIRQGERIALWNRFGEANMIDGPRLLLLTGQQVQILPRFSAGPAQYLVIRFKDGHKEHVRGPAAAWFDPVLHEEITIQPAIGIDANEALVVYRQEEKD